jgi:hypothetical protein
MVSVCNDCSIVKKVDIATVLDQQAYIPCRNEVAEMREKSGFLVRDRCVKVGFWRDDSSISTPSARGFHFRRSCGMDENPLTDFVLRVALATKARELRSI